MIVCISLKRKERVVEEKALKVLSSYIYAIFTNKIPRIFYSVNYNKYITL